jgi:hypothetical protein
MKDGLLEQRYGCVETATKDAALKDSIAVDREELFVTIEYDAP